MQGPGKIIHSGGTLTINEPLPSEISLCVLSLATATNIQGAYSLSNLDLGAGNLQGAGSLTIQNQFDWTGGTLDLPITFNGLAANFTGALDKSLFDNLNLGTSTITHSAGRLLLKTGGVLTNGGVYNWNGGEIEFANTSAVFNNTGVLNVGFDGDLSNQAGSFTNDGTFNLGNNNTLDIDADFSNNGLLTGIGAINFNGAFSHTGTVAPGNSPGTLTLSAFDNSSGILEIGIESQAGAGIGHDFLVVSDTAVVGGTLNVVLENGFTPNEGDEYTFLDADSLTGNFFTINLPNCCIWDVNMNQPNTGEITLEVLDVDLPATNDCAVPNLVLDNSILPSKNYDAELTITSEGIIPNLANVNHIAGQYIDLNPGFSVDLGGTFLAAIVGCP